MCGIVGWVDYVRDPGARGEIVDRMTGTMASRGPDDTGRWTGPNAAVGHRRLAVIDPVGGAQPMTLTTPAGTIVLVYSGEIYNFAELRARLAGFGHHFRTGSDTEVVLHAYLEWGAAAAERFNGMFAFAVWDERDRRLTLVRDRLGVKPLYYQPTAHGVLFGSEPKAILAHPDIDPIVDTEGLRELVAFTMTPGWALWRGMREVLPGGIVTVTAEGIQTRTYWSLPVREHLDDLPATVASVRDMLADTVQRQLVADVPLGILLSGGLDSSAITALASGRLAESGERLRTYSVDFVGREESFEADNVWGTPDSPYVRHVAGLVGSDHSTVAFRPDELADPTLRRTVIAARDLPNTFGEMDTSLYLFCRTIREERVVVLSGESADEVFGGYAWLHDPVTVDTPTFPWLAFRSPLGGERAAPFRPEVRALLDIDTFVADEYATAAAAVEHLPNSGAIERRMRLLCNLHLTRFVRTLLDRKDRISMAVGLEVRVPYCDHRLVEYVYNAPWSMKNFDGREKSLLRHACADLLPASVLERRKSPYPSTQDPVYATALQQQVKELLTEPDHPVFTLVDPDWLTATAERDLTLPSDSRHAVDRVLDLYHWLDLYRPNMRLN
ncbi:asparagine synthase (glutamine-hydrolyzing) [Actinophytocola sp.]|uniref:asparagine synthase (glutamine-hydrolyzing) n=1 Tax=Actinophytocola sp. TaxID=1872138 RepID=UPI002ED415E3